MGLNEKLAARRRDLGIEAEKAKKAERDAIEVEAVNRITESGSMQHATTNTEKINGEEVLTKAAINRFTTWDHVSFWGMLALSLGCFSEGAWLAGIIGIIFAFVVRANAISKYKKKIVDEKRKKSWRADVSQNTEIDKSAVQTNLGEINDNRGSKVTIDTTNEVELFRKAAEQGDANAQLNLGCMYADGNGVPKEVPKAVEWWKKAAAQGNKYAQFNLGVYYGRGEGVSKNLVLTYAWVNLAAAHGHETAQKLSAQCKIGLNSSQLAEAKRLVANWKKGDILHTSMEAV